MAEEYGWNVEDLVLPENIQEKAKLAPYVKGRKTVVYYPDEELRRYPRDPNYYIGNYGTVYSKYRNKKLNIKYDKDGYEDVRMKFGNVRLHRAILETFNPIENSQAMQVNHIDGCKSNNVYDPDHDRVNLEWCTCQENIAHAIEHNLRLPCGENHHSAVNTEEEIWQICEYLNQGLHSNEIAKLMNREFTHNFQSLLYNIKNKNSWAFISDNFPNIKVQHHQKKGENN